MLVARHGIQADRIEGGANNVDPGQRNHDVNEFVPWPANTSLAGGPESRQRMYQWWNLDTQVSPVLRAQAVHTNLPSTIIGDGVWGTNTRHTDVAQLSSPTGTPAVGVGQNPVFFLSEAELYLTLNQTAASDRIVNRVAYDGTVGAASWFWMRTAGHNTDHVAAVTMFSDSWNAVSADITGTFLAFRPAIWVRR